jgi:hypothetical protein
MLRYLQGLALGERAGRISTTIRKALIMWVDDRGERSHALSSMNIAFKFNTRVQIIETLVQLKMFLSAVGSRRKKLATRIPMFLF